MSGSIAKTGKVLALALLAVIAVGCNGPKDTCEGTMDSFAGNINSQDFEGITNLMMPNQVSKYGLGKLTAMFNQNWFGCKNFKYTYMQADVDKSGQLCIARTVMRWDYKIRGKKEETQDAFSDVYTLHRIDGKWFIEVPGASKLVGY